MKELLEMKKEVERNQALTSSSRILKMSGHSYPREDMPAFLYNG
jgi:hypothetical protein